MNTLLFVNKPNATCYFSSLICTEYILISNYFVREKQLTQHGIKYITVYLQPTINKYTYCTFSSLVYCTM